MNCSLVFVQSGCRAGEAEARASQGGGSSRMNRIARLSTNIIATRAGAGGAGGGCGARDGGSGIGMQGSSSPGEEAGGSASVELSGGGTGRQSGGADAGTGSGGCGEAAAEACSSGSGRHSGRGSGNERPVAFVRDGGPLARRWWRAAVAAVHCAMDELEAMGSSEAGLLDQVLDPSLAMPETDTGGTQRTILQT